MEELVREIIEKIIQRSKHKETIIYEESRGINQRLFIEAGTICIQGVSLLGLKQLSVFDSNSSWVHSVLEGMSYDVVFHFQLNTNSYRLIPFNLLTDWPIKLYGKRGELIKGFPTKAITYQQVTILEPGTKIILADGQQLTAMARETLIKKKITYLERTD